MNKINLIGLLAGTASLTWGCAPLVTYQPAQYPYWNHTGAYYTDTYFNPQPQFASYDPNSNLPPFYAQSYSQQPYEPVDAPARRAILDQAFQVLGVRYKLGGESPAEGFDCSGLTLFVYQRGQGIRLPRTADEQSRASRTISFEQMRPGDLIFFRTSGGKVNHVGIYIGRGDFIHAATGGGKVTIDNLGKPYWQQRLVKFGTFLPQN